MYNTPPSLLDCGAGDGRVLDTLMNGLKYAIEKSKILVQSLSKDIFVVGTDFTQNTLIDKKVDVIFSNPPYSEYEGWAEKIILEANARYIYLVIPSRWESSEAISEAIKSRKAKFEILGQFDFMEADRKARAVINVIKFDLAYGRTGSDTSKVDPFTLWFEKNFQVKKERFLEISPLNN